ncbi:RNA-directed DNA polymerase, eukaryota, reverse transcriptase zinc-binding domain protein [Tanacetum coccineum]
MNIISFNSCGMGVEKCKAISKLCNKHNVFFLGIQETHLTMVDSFKAKCLWGNFQFEYAVSPSSGRSGGLISIWDSNAFTKLNVIPHENLLITEALALDSLISDHTSIILKPSSLDFRLTPFKFYNSWPLDNQLTNLVTEFLEHHIVVIGSNPTVGFKNKMKALKPLIKEWSKNRFSSQPSEKDDMIKKIKEFDENIERGLNGFTFAFYKKFWDIIKDDVVGFVQDFFVTVCLPSGCNTSFIALILKVPNPMVISDFRPISLIEAQYKIIAKVMANRLARVIDSIISQEQSSFIKHRQILDCPLMVNKLIKWCKRKNANLMVFKIDFEKAFDTVSWDFLFQVMHFMGFSEKLIKWISAMEGLHVDVEDAMVAGLYQGFKVNTLTLSHLFFADDTLFIGEWSRANIKNMVTIPECFYQVSGLKINIHKSNLFGIGIPFDEVRHLASIIRCNAMQTPFYYLGLPIDCNMAKTNSWDSIFDKFSKRLSKWKSSLLSIGGRATLISSVLGSIALASKEKGGLGIGSLYSLNHALIQKWHWRFFNNPQALWVHLIKAIHGDHEDASNFFSHVRDHGVWGRIVGSINTMHEKGIVSHSSLQRRVGISMKFWTQTWVGNSSLQQQFPRLFGLVFNKDCTIRDCWNNGWALAWSRPITSGTNANHLLALHNILGSCSLNYSEDTWIWSIRNSIFTNLSQKGIDLVSLALSICDSGIENINHTLWFCSFATSVWHRVFVWLDLHTPDPSNLQDLYNWIDDMHIVSSRKSILDVICGVILWSFWNFRNETIFVDSPPRRDILFDKIVECSYRWYSSRNNSSSIS